MVGPVIPTPCSLSAFAPGDSGLVEVILFDTLRELCTTLGIREGETVHCRAGSGGVLVLDTEDGHTVSLARDWARFISVVPRT